MRRWEGVRKEIKKITVKRSEGGRMKVVAPELVVALAQMQDKGRCGEEEGRRCSTKTLKETAQKQESEDTEEMVQWRCIR